MKKSKKYHIGDMVKVKSLGWYNNASKFLESDDLSNSESQCIFKKEMSTLCEKELFIYGVTDNGYILEDYPYEWDDWMLLEIEHEICKYCSPFENAPFEETFRSAIWCGNIFTISSWDCSSKFKIRYCPMCARQLRTID